LPVASRELQPKISACNLQSTSIDPTLLGWIYGDASRREDAGL
jgi:hypothetical protein